MKEKLIEEIRNILSDYTGISVEQILPTSSFADDLDIDSMDMMEVVFDIEDRYGLNLTCTPSEISTVNDLADILSKCIDKNKSVA